MKARALKEIFLRKKSNLDDELEIEDVDTSAIGDLSFLLLIFFIVTSSFLLKQGISFSMPAKDAKPQRIEKSEIIKIQPTQNAFFYKGQVLPRFKMKEALSQSLQQKKKLVVVIKMNPKVSYDRFIDTLSLVRESKISRISVEAN